MTWSCNRAAEPCTRHRSHAQAAGQRTTVVLGGARAFVRRGTTVPAQTPALRVCFLVFLSAVLFFFEGGFFCKVLVTQLGFSLAPIKPFRVRLDSRKPYITCRKFQFCIQE